MLLGVLCALGAGLLWGVVFVAPLLLESYPGIVLAFGRYIAFGLIALSLAWSDRATLAKLTREDWIEAVKLSLVGNLLYYTALATAIQLAGAPVPTLLIGTLPVVISICSNLSAGETSSESPVPWRRLAPSLIAIGAGVVLVHDADHSVQASDVFSYEDYMWGLMYALGAVACWTWYPIRNSRWLRSHADGRVRVWATAQGLTTLPLALIAMVGYVCVDLLSHPQGSGFSWPLGPEPSRFVGLMLLLGFASSWLGTVLWNVASKRLPPSLAGQLIVFETLSALSYTYWWKGIMPDKVTLLGIAVLMSGVVFGVRTFRTDDK